MLPESLLEKLADGQFHSGDELGDALGVSRTAIWKQIKKIEALGLTLETVKGRGYRLKGGLDLLSEKCIRQKLSSQAATLISALDVVGVVDSTNTLALSKAREGHSGYVCTAEQQVAGRGRRGRRWQGTYAGSLSLSVVWEFAGGVASLEGLSLAVGVAVIDALASAGVNGVELKWPNDILHGGRKLSGVLLEIAGDAAGPCQVVVGIGLNVSMPAERMADVEQPWIDVASITGKKIGRNQLLALLLNELMPLLSRFEHKGFQTYLERWQNLDAYAGRDVLIQLGSETIAGTACGVDASGAIVIATDTGKRLFTGGEVSLRPVDELKK